MSENGKSRTAFWRARCYLAVTAVLLSLGAARAENALGTPPYPDQSRAEYERVSKEITLSTERLAGSLPT
jgi:hypothetical protein